MLRNIRLSLRTRELDCYDYATSTNPPILHRKEMFLPPGHELVTKFARLTHQEEKHGLLDETASIGTRGVATKAGGAGVPDSGAPADQAKKRKERKGRRERTTKLTKSAKQERTPEERNASVRGILFVWAASLARMS